MKAVGEYLIVRIPEPKMKTEGGIELPGDTKQQFYYGRVESVGEAVSTIEPGGYVVFEPQAAMPIELNPLRPGSSRIVIVGREQVLAEIDADELLSMSLAICEQLIVAS